MLRKVEDNFSWFLIGVHCVLVLPLAFYLNVWMDEASTLFTTDFGFAHTFRTVFNAERQAPLYFLVLSLWRAVSASVIWARILSIVFSLIAIKIFVDFSCKLFSREESLLVSAFFALHPFLIWTSLEIRCYSLVILLSVLLLKFFWKIFIESEGGKKDFLLFIGIAIAAIYTQYYLGFMLVAFFVALLLTRRFKPARDFAFTMFPVAIAILPLIGIIANQMEANAAGYEKERSLIEGARNIWNHFLTFALPTEINAPDQPSIAAIIRKWIIRVFAILFLLNLFRTKFRTVTSNAWIAGIIVFSTVLLLFGTYFLVGLTYTALRHSALLLAPIAIVGGLLLLREIPKMFWIVLAVVYLFSFSHAFINMYPALAKRGDWIRVARFIETKEAPNQPIIVYRAHDALTLGRHYQGENRILPDEKFLDWWAEEGEPGSENSRRSEIEFVISEIPKDAREIWLATESSCQTEAMKNSCRPLEKFIVENYTVIEEGEFYQERMRLLRRK